MTERATRKATTRWAAAGAACAVLLAGLPGGCGSRSNPDPGIPTTPKAESPKGEAEMGALLRAMEDTVAMRDRDGGELVDALRRVAAADRAVEDLRLTAAERAALDARFAARKAELRDRLDE
jgi:hypothetical protein